MLLLNSPSYSERPTTHDAVHTKKKHARRSLFTHSHLLPNALPSLYVAMASTHHRPNPRSTYRSTFYYPLHTTPYPIASVVTAGQAFSLANRSAAQHARRQYTQLHAPITKKKNNLGPKMLRPTYLTLPGTYVRGRTRAFYLTP